MFWLFDKEHIIFNRFLIFFNSQIMKYLKPLILLSFFAYEVAYSASPTSFSMVSPDGKLSAKIELKDKIYYSLAFGERQIIDPFTSHNTLILFCDILDAVKKNPYERDPRSIAKKAEAYLKKSDYPNYTRSLYIV